MRFRPFRSPPAHDARRRRSRSWTRSNARTAALGELPRVKLAPGRQVPFSTLRYRLRDGNLVQGLQPVTQVDCRAERIAGENTITEMRLPP